MADKNSVDKLLVPLLADVNKHFMIWLLQTVDALSNEMYLPLIFRKVTVLLLGLFATL
jgi:hypothetical protein